VYCREIKKILYFLCLLTILPLLTGCAAGYEPKNDNDKDALLLLEKTNKTFNKKIAEMNCRRQEAYP